MLYTCPLCGGPATKAMYAGFPMKLCGDEACCCVFDGCAWLMEYLPFNGWLIRYTNYWSCLWEFVTGVSDEKANDD